MKRLWAVVFALMLLTGCGGQQDRQPIMALREQVMQAEQVTFSVDLTADYIDTVERFAMDCEVDETGTLRFTVTEPETIRGIAGGVSGSEGKLCFEEQALAFALMAADRLSPVSGPWLVMKALRSGELVAIAEEGEEIRLTLNDSFEEDPLTADIWVSEGTVTAAEVAWRGRRVLSMEIEDFEIR